MGLLARLLLGPPRRPDEVADLSVDLERWTVLGLDRGATQADVERWLGPPEDWFARRRGHLLYPALGVRVSVDGQGRLSGTSFQWSVVSSQSSRLHSALFRRRREASRQVTLRTEN